MKKLPFEVLEKKILDLLYEEETCVLATSAHGKPRATTLEYFARGYSIYFLAEGGQKVANLEANPIVSVAIHRPHTGRGSIVGLQITGEALIGRKGSPLYDEGTRAFGERKGYDVVELPDGMMVIKVIPSRMEYLDVALSRKGYAARHLVQCHEDEPN